MRRVTITRTEEDDYGTFGLWQSDSGFQVYTGEPPWLKNESNISCIPSGVYQCEIINSPKHGRCYEVKSVPGRTSVEIHSGNFCGNISKGIKSDTKACILPGRAIDQIGGQKAVISSKDALKGLMDDLAGEAFQLTIEWA